MVANDFFGEVIHSYTRAQATEDGALIDISEFSKDRGFKLPVAVTRTVWTKYIEWSDEDSIRQTSQDEKGRMHDILFMLFLAIKKSPNVSKINYVLHVIPCDGKSQSAKLTQLKAVISGGDDGEPVITILSPGES